jgi:hypothetical protein
MRSPRRGDAIVAQTYENLPAGHAPITQARFNIQDIGAPAGFTDPVGGEAPSANPRLRTTTNRLVLNGCLAAVRSPFAGDAVSLQ